MPAELDVHLVCDNLATHKTPIVNEWLARHPRFHVHFTPTGSSWLNQVERWFGYLTDQLTRRGVHKSVAALEKDVTTWIQHWTENPGRSSGARPPKESSTPSPDISNGFQERDTSPPFSPMNRWAARKQSSWPDPVGHHRTALQDIGMSVGPTVVYFARVFAAPANAITTRHLDSGSAMPTMAVDCLIFLRSLLVAKSVKVAVPAVARPTNRAVR
ncbi:transposase [Nocardia zapadnayensis]|uniref:transposase n=1 Tax=Nocardia rhamnosiphila TaxID=426716 RepID=UPI002247D620|nr:transposase [Nocardia zapadnayensis]MCX0275267.1 transposase [Nocardia zapadnayensis]